MSGVPALDAAALAPVIAPVVGMLAVLLLDAIRPWSPTRVWRGLIDTVAAGSLVAAAVAVVVLSGSGLPRSTACVGGVPGPSGEPGDLIVLPGCSYTVSGLTLALQAVVLAGALSCLLLALDGPAGRDRAVHHTLLLAATTGAVALAGARDLATLVVALELASLPVAGLLALHRDARGAQAALTFLLTAIGSLALSLLGVALLYAATGSLHLERIATSLAGAVETDSTRLLLLAVVGMLLLVAGLGYKLSVVPFHLWTPDAYAGAPLPVAAFLSVVSKAAGAAVLVVVLVIGLPVLAGVWAPALVVLAGLTMTVGNVVALRQRVAIRLLAWSAIAQAGWVLLPLAGASDGRIGLPSPGGADGADGADGALRAAVTASVGYLVAYVVATTAVFAVVVLMARHHRAGEGHTLEDYRGLARREPVAAAILGFGLACLAGLPPGVMGLVAKVVAIRPVVEAQLWPLAVLAAVNVILGLVYYLRWAALLVGPAGAQTPSWRVRPAEGLVLGAAGAGCLILSVLGQVIASAVRGALG